MPLRFNTDQDRSWVSPPTRSRTRSDEVEILGRHSGPYGGPADFGELDREMTDPTRSAMDQHSLAGLQMPMLEEPLPGGKGADGDRCSLNGSKGEWRRGDGGGLGDAELGEGPLTEPVVHAEDRLAESEVADAGADGSDGSGELMRGDGAGAESPGLIVGGGIPGEFCGSDACGRDADENLTGAWLGLGKGGFDQLWGLFGVRKAHNLHEYLQRLQ